MFNFNNKKFYIQPLFLILSLILLLSSCASMSTSQQHYLDADAFVAQNNFVEAAAVIEREREGAYTEKERVLYYLDIGMLYHFAGEYEKSNQALDEAERGIEELYTASVSKGLLSGFLNDNALDYGGEDYEDIYINVFKALNYIALGDNEAAMVEIRRFHIKTNLLSDKYRQVIADYNAASDAEAELFQGESRFHSSALAHYLAALLYRYRRESDGSRIEQQAVATAFNEQQQLYDFSMPQLPEQNYEPGKAYLSALAFTGYSPRKLAETLYIDSGENIVFLTGVDQGEDYANELVGFNYIYFPGVKPGLHMKFQFPQLSAQGSRVERIALEIDGVETAQLARLESMENIAVDTFRVRQPLIIGKTIIRAIGKGVAKEVGKDAMNEALPDDTGGLLAGILVGIAADVAVDLTENADLRAAHYFPAYASVLDMALEPGEYNLAVNYYGSEVLLYRDEIGLTNLREGELNIVESFTFE